MSCYLIYYQDGAKIARPVFSPQEYLALRDGGRQKDLVGKARSGDAEAKKKLLQFNYSCIPGEDGKLKGAKTMSPTLGMDIDFHPEDPDYEEKMASVPDLVLSKKDELGLLMLERSATKGYHLVFKRGAFPKCDTPLKSQEANLKWASNLLGVQYDEGAKDITRVFFTTTGSKDDLLFCGAPHLFIAHDKATGRWAEDNKINCNLATAYFELLANAFGLGAIIMSYPSDVICELAPEARKLLGIPEDHYMKLIVGFGYPEIPYARGVQKDRSAKIHRYSKEHPL